MINNIHSFVPPYKNLDAGSTFSENKLWGRQSPSTLTKCPYKVSFNAFSPQKG